MVECPNTLPEDDRDPFLMRKLEGEVNAFAAACIEVALQVQATGKYPVSSAMRELLDDIETNGDSVKLWVMERCTVEPEANETTQALYDDFCTWCATSGARPQTRARLRSALLSYNRMIQPLKRRSVDPDTGEIKPLWCLSGIRLNR